MNFWQSSSNSSGSRTPLRNAIFLLSASVACLGWGFLGGNKQLVGPDPRIEIIKSAETSALSQETQGANKLLCVAEARARDLVKERPMDGLTLARYAGVLQLFAERQLSVSSCRQSPESDRARTNDDQVESEPKLSDVVDLALARAPYDRGILLTAALVAHWSNPDSSENLDSKRYELLRRVMKTPGGFSESQRRIIANEISSAMDVTEAVPTDARSVLLISQLKNLSSNMFARFGALEGPIEKLQLATLQALPVGDEGRFLKEFTDVAATPQVLAQIDHLRGIFTAASEDEMLAQFFNLRSGLREVSVLRGVLKDDTKPESGSSIVRWRQSEFFALDEASTSVGAIINTSSIDLSDKDSAIMAIQLTSSDPAAILSSDELQVFCSVDNSNWRGIKIERSITTRFDGDTVLLLELGGTEAAICPIVKIHFNVPIHRGRFKDSSERLLRVFTNA